MTSTTTVRLAALLLVLFTARVAGSADRAPCGTPLANHRGVTAFSNGTGSFETSCGSLMRGAASGRPGDELPGPNGLEYQCVELVRRFYREALGVNTTTGWTGAGLGNAIYYDTTADQKGLIRYPNNGSERPAVDDIVVFGTNHQYGHVAIIKEIHDNSVTLMEQNMSPTGTATITLQQDSETGRWTLGPRSATMPALSWLRKRPSQQCAVRQSFCCQDARLAIVSSFVVCNQCNQPLAASSATAGCNSRLFSRENFVIPPNGCYEFRHAFVDTSVPGQGGPPTCRVGERASAKINFVDGEIVSDQAVCQPFDTPGLCCGCSNSP